MKHVSRREVLASADVESIEEFAVTSARLAAPFADRTVILAELGVTERRWFEIRDRLRVLIERDVAEGHPSRLVERYRTAFERASGSPHERVSAPSAANVELDTDETLPLQPMHELVEAVRALPFDSLDVPAPSRRFVMERQRERSSGTVMGPSVLTRSTLPFQKGTRARLAEPRNEPGWTIERYAVLCIDLHVSGRPEAEVLAAAGITRDTYIGLDAFWEQEMHRDPALRERWASASSRRRIDLERGG